MIQAGMAVTVTEGEVYQASFNRLSPAELERLAVLGGELNEAAGVVAKILRYGYEASNPFDPKSETNREALERELGDVANGIRMLCVSGDVVPERIQAWADEKQRTINQWLHHQSHLVTMAPSPLVLEPIDIDD